MFYNVRIDRVGENGVPLGNPTIETLASESDAIMLMRKAIERGLKLTQPMQFSVYGPGGRLIVNYTTATNDAIAP